LKTNYRTTLMGVDYAAEQRKLLEERGIPMTRAIDQRERDLADLATHWIGRYRAGAFIQIHGHGSTHSQQWEDVESLEQLAAFLHDNGCSIVGGSDKIREAPEGGSVIRTWRPDEIPVGRVVARRSGDGEPNPLAGYPSGKNYTRRMIIAVADERVILGGFHSGKNLQQAFNYLKEHYVLVASEDGDWKFDYPCGTWESGQLGQEYAHWLNTARMTKRLLNLCGRRGMDIVDGGAVRPKKATW
jgi:hypothetical protein